MKSDLDKFPKLEDYTATFESQGTTFIFEDLVAEYYDPAEAVSISSNNLKKCFFSKKRMEKLNEEGLMMSSQTLNEIAISLDNFVSNCLKDIPLYREKKDFSSEDAHHMIKTMGEICKVYFYFDFALWDKTFEQSKKDEDAKKKVEIVQNYKNKLRADMDPVFFGDGYLSVLIDQVSKKTSIPKIDLGFYRCTELFELVEKGVVVPKEELLARITYVHYLDENHIIHFFSGQDAFDFIDRFLEDKNLSIPKDNIIHGKTANSTSQIVRAQVRILARDYGNPVIIQESMAEMKEGEILVSQTTDPELLPAMRKASAIITDVGGLLSHSAITSRELRIPCVIDTKNASKILKTGDLVEVDAEQGIIRIIK